MKELQKNNENVVTGLLDTETELGDVLMGLDEIRETHLSTQDFVKNISHFTKVLVPRTPRICTLLKNPNDLFFSECL